MPTINPASRVTNLNQWSKLSSSGSSPSVIANAYAATPKITKLKSQRHRRSRVRQRIDEMLIDTHRLSVSEWAIYRQ